MNFSESDHFQRLVGGAPERPSEPDWLEQWRRREEALLQKHLESVQVFALELPEKIKDLDRTGQAVVALVEPFLVGNRERVSHG
jgi:hypothetical protein